jgi:hypothetical protein
MAAMQDAANWPTPDAHQFGSALGANQKSPATITHAVKYWAKHGQAAPASSSSLGSRQGWWPTPEGMAGGKTSRGGSRKDELLLSGMVKQWATPTNCDHKGATTPEACKQWESRGQNLPEMVVSHWATPKTPTGGPETAKRKQELGRTASGGGDLASQANGKLNPRWVETLMGLPIGWTMPSCTSPQTIAPMSCDSSATELCQPPQSELSEFSLAS